MRFAQLTISLLLLSLLSPLHAAGLPADDQLLATLKPDHPRLLLTDERVGEMRALVETDAVYRDAINEFLTRIDLYVDRPPVQNSNDWNGWREIPARVFALGFACRFFGGEKYDAALKRVLLDACAFPDWHEKQSFLDTGEMTGAMALGYDWLYNDLSKEERETIVKAIVEKGLKQGQARYTANGAGDSWWTKSNHNWNLVCNSGMVIGALAVAESEPKLAQQVLAAACKSMGNALPSYDPDGAWMEGFSYWMYATQNAVLAMASLQTALGSDFGLPDHPGLAAAWRFAAYATAPDGVQLARFADSDAHHWSLPYLFWLSKRLNVPAAAEYERGFFGKPHPWWPDAAKEVNDPRFAPMRALDLIWYVPPAANVPKVPDTLPRDVRFTGLLDFAVFRSQWSNINALCLFVKAGPNGGIANHGHLDAGNFELYALGIRWAYDFGKASYGTGYFDNGTRENPGKRWTYVSVGSAGHNVPMLDGKNQDPFAAAPMTDFIGNNNRFSFAIIDLTAVDGVKSAKRGIALLNRRDVLVQDEFELEKPAEIAWGMNTEAKITCNGKDATLERWNKTLHATILSPEGAAFTAEKLDGNVKSDRLVVRLKDQQGSVRVAVLLAPDYNGKLLPLPELKPLAEWTPVRKGRN